MNLRTVMNIKLMAAMLRNRIVVALMLIVRLLEIVVNACDTWYRPVMHFQLTAAFDPNLSSTPPSREKRNPYSLARITKDATRGNTSISLGVVAVIMSSQLASSNSRYALSSAR